MGNLNCSKCLQGFEAANETDLKPSIILKAFSNFKENVESPKKKARPVVKPSNDVTHAVLRLQALWRMYVCQKQYLLIKRVIKANHNYFPKEELRYNLSDALLPTKTKRTEKFVYPSGAVYRGDWLGGFRHGYGSIEWPDGASYEGAWSYGYPFGFGKFTHIDNETYSGQWKNPYAGAHQSTPYHNTSLSSPPSDGYLWLYIKQESLSKAPPATNPMKFSMNHDKSVKTIMKTLNTHSEAVKESKILLEETFSEKFEKMFAQTELEGGAKYKGEMVSGKRVGKGINVWENGDVYKGEWEKDLQNGWGWNFWVDGSTYIGGYKDNMKDGVGEYQWEDGTRYIGGWKDNNMDGVGKYSWSDGREYIGEWANGTMHGFGMFTAKDGKRYEGKWNLGKKHGVGYTVLKDGNATLDNWENGRIKKSNIL